MSKKNTILELTNLLAISLRHKIGSIANKNEIYAQKYAKDSEILFNEARKISSNLHFNSHDKIEIKRLLEAKLRKELEEREFIDNKKFDLMEEEIEKALEELNLN